MGINILHLFWSIVYLKWILNQTHHKLWFVLYEINWIISSLRLLYQFSMCKNLIYQFRKNVSQINICKIRVTYHKITANVNFRIDSIKKEARIITLNLKFNFYVTKAEVCVLEPSSFLNTLCCPLRKPTRGSTFVLSFYGPDWNKKLLIWKETSRIPVWWEWSNGPTLHTRRVVD